MAVAPEQRAASASAGSSQGTNATETSQPAANNSGSPMASTQIQRPRTRLQSDIIKAKVFTDGTVHYGNFCSTGEPQNLQEALDDPVWRKAMEEEYSTLMKNQTWHLVPTKQGIKKS